MTRIVLDPGIERMLREHPDVQAAVLGVAREIHTHAVARAGPHRRTGGYIDGLVVEDFAEHGAMVAATAEYSDWVEYGTGSRRLGIAPTPCPHPEPKETGVFPQLIMTGAVGDVTR